MLHQKTGESQPHVHGLTPSVSAARNSSAHACIRLHMFTVTNSVVEILNILDAQGLGRYAPDSKLCKWMSGGDPRIGTFYQMRPTMGILPVV